MHVRCDNQYKSGADRGDILGQPMLFECRGICILSPVHESEMRAYLVCVLTVKYVSHPFCLNSARVLLDWTVLLWNFWGIFKTFLGGSVNRVIYWDYIVNRRFFYLL